MKYTYNSIRFRNLLSSVIDNALRSGIYVDTIADTMKEICKEIRECKTDVQIIGVFVERELPSLEGEG